MWTQYWVVTTSSEERARDDVQVALHRWTPDGVPAATIITARLYRGPDDFSISDTISQALAEIQQTVATSHRSELSRRLQAISHRPIGIPPQAGWVVLDGHTPRSPRPLDLRSTGNLRWVVTVQWEDDPPSSSGA